MSSGDATNMQCPNTGRKRIRFADANDASLSAIAFNNTPGQSPSAAAKACSKAAVGSLHHLLRPHFQELAEKFILAFSTWYYKDKKLKKMKSDADFIPSPAKVGLTLEPFEEVRKSEEFNTLAERLASVVDTCQREFRDIILACTDLNVKSQKRNIQKSFAIALPAIAEGFLALDNVKNYPKHQVVSDLLDQHQDEMIGHLNVSRADFNEIYKTTHELTTLPTSSGTTNTPPPQNDTNASSAATVTTPSNNATGNSTPAQITPQTTGRIMLNLEGEGFRFLPNPYNGVGSPPGVFINETTAATPNNGNNTTATNSTATAVSPANNETNAAIQAINASARTLGIEGLNEPDGLNPLFDYGTEITNLDQGQDQDNDEAMEEAADPNNPAATGSIVGARAHIINQVRDVVSCAFIASTNSFVMQVSLNEQNARIKKATTKQSIERAADNIVETLQNEGSVDPTVLKGLITAEAKKRTNELNKRIQSLEAKLDLENKNKNKTNNNRRNNRNDNNNNNNSKNDRRGASKGAALKKESNNSNNHSSNQNRSRGRANASAAGSSNASSKSNRSRSSSKSNMRRGSSKTKRSNSSGRSNKK